MRESQPFSLAKRQLEIDRARLREFPFLLAHKWARMAVSPLALLRGSAPLYYELIATDPLLKDGPSGHGWIVGDAHIENFGAYRVESPGAASTATFDVNDFDEATLGMWHTDVLRLATSAILGARSFGITSEEAIGLAKNLLDAWSRAAFDGARLKEPPPSVARLMRQVQARTRLQFLTDRTERMSKSRRFVRGERYRNLTKEIVKSVNHVLTDYQQGLPKSERPDDAQLELLDAALRIAGTGSLGVLRIAALTRGKGGHGGSWIIDIKEQRNPSAPGDAPKLAPADRVISAINACLVRPPRLVGSAKLRDRSMLVRRLAPQEDKLSFRKIERIELPALAMHLGRLLGRVHARGRKGKAARWSESDHREILERAIYLAGVHESMYLALPTTLSQVR